MNKDFFEIEYKIYYEDTDFNGSVYHANYFKFAERARTELLLANNISQKILFDEYRLTFAMRKQDIQYLKPLVFEEIVKISTRILKINKASFDFEQILSVNGENRAIINSNIVCVNHQFKPVRVPNFIIDKLKIHSSFV